MENNQKDKSSQQSDSMSIQQENNSRVMSMSGQWHLQSASRSPQRSELLEGMPHGYHSQRRHPSFVVDDTEES